MKENNVSIGSNRVFKLSEAVNGSSTNMTCSDCFTSLDLAETVVKVKLAVVRTFGTETKPVNFWAKIDLSITESAFLETVQPGVLPKYERKTLSSSAPYAKPKRFLQ